MLGGGLGIRTKSAWTVPLYDVRVVQPPPSAGSFKEQEPGIYTCTNHHLLEILPPALSEASL